MWGDKMKLRAQMSVQDTLYSLRVVELIRGDGDGFQHTSFNKSKSLRQTLDDRIVFFSIALVSLEFRDRFDF